jgi:hypothetical protein
MQTATETIEISGLPSETRELLDEIGRSEGKTGEEFLRTLIEAEILSRRSFREILAPVHESFAASGTTEEEFDAIIEEAREAVYRERQDAGR